MGKVYEVHFGRGEYEDEGEENPLQGIQQGVDPLTGEQVDSSLETDRGFMGDLAAYFAEQTGKPIQLPPDDPPELLGPRNNRI